MERWKSRIGVILAVAGSAVGVGNFLRFPGQVVANGGGSFMIPYFAALLLLGLPLCWAEWIMGRSGGEHNFHSCPAIMYKLGKSNLWKYIGAIGVLIPMAIMMYYIVIETWCLVYAVKYLFGQIDLGSSPEQYMINSKNLFATIAGTTNDGFHTEGKINITFALLIVIFSINFYLVYNGLTRGIEKFCTYAMPLMGLCAIIVLFRILTLGTPDPNIPEQNVINGLGYMWNPKPLDNDSPWWTALLNPQVWMSAAGQIFFTLSVGLGVIINYASYLSNKDDVVLSGLTATATNEFFEVCLGGLITVTAAFIFLGASGSQGGVFSLGFHTLPVVFMHMPAGSFFGFIWFFMLFLAAITSSISMLQPSIAFLEETANIKRKGSISILGIICGLGSLFVIYFSKDLKALDTLDFWAGTTAIYLLAMSQIILFGWVYGVDRGLEEAKHGALINLPSWFGFVIKYVSSLYLLTVFVLWAYNNLPGYITTLLKGGVPLFSVCILAGLYLFIVTLINNGQKYWSEKTSNPEDYNI
ncbi:MAG: sodium:calcium symporter [Deltaproteobacteria bacterium]|nr:sodium:calcium symporter [Deltaproteobacteria bacterium]